MKVLLIITCMIGFCCPDLCLGQAKTLSITGSLKGLSAASEITITHYLGSKIDALAKVKTRAGTFTASWTSSSNPEFYFLKVAGIPSSLTLFVGSGKITLTGDLAQWPKAKVSGSESHTAYQEYQDVIADEEAKGRSLTQQYNSLIGSTDSTALANVQQQLSESIVNYEKLQQDFVAKHPEAFYSAVIINNSKWNWLIKRKAYEELSAFIKASKYGVILAENIAKWKKESGLLEIGDNVPDFTAPTGSGASLSIQKELAGNKLTLIDFWASWCVPCRQENPNLLQVYRQFKDQGFNIVGISLDEKGADWKLAIEKDGLPWAQVSDLKGWASPIAKLYFAGMPFNFIPQNFLVDSKGKILARNLRGDQLNKKVTELLKGGNL
ncbi:TlpA family protein disulfide reductase [Pedobacter ginsengisoli]|uniref:TlpA family protein disulfide reductase n=1 Tax=Pedobacter ginsengisoli TaxID=363852 RepID=UPI00254E8BC2|nr:TlpA disulfide reductase family protein [Pedobacter ginsengisoli]